MMNDEWERRDCKNKVRMGRKRTKSKPGKGIQKYPRLVNMN